MSRNTCVSCGQTVASGTSFCTNCGTPFVVPVAAQRVGRTARAQRGGGCCLPMLVLTMILVVYSAFFLAILALDEPLKIQDAASVLNAAKIQAEQDNLPIEVRIYTTKMYPNDDAAALLNDARILLGMSDRQAVVIDVDTVHRKVAIIGNKFNSDIARAAREKFASSFAKDHDFTNATLAAVRYIKAWKNEVDAPLRPVGRIIRIQTYALLGPAGTVVVVIALTLPVLFLIFSLALLWWRAPASSTRGQVSRSSEPNRSWIRSEGGGSAKYHDSRGGAGSAGDF